MKSYVVLAPPPARKAGVPDALRFLFVKDGFSWPALFFPFLWMLSRRLFLAAAIYIVLSAVLVALSDTIGTPALAALVALRLGLGFLGNDMRRHFLARRGYVEIGSATGVSRDEAEIRFFMNRRDDEPDAATPIARPPAAPGPVIGLFPSAEAAR
ncbi:MAG: DUF2628 domain-containing protein [Bosea sp.]|nr:DUF2628 domain-containing protein [Bosea sp. (in: a-proteobacteria)]